jgi:hypothetical protein
VPELDFARGDPAVHEGCGMMTLRTKCVHACCASGRRCCALFAVGARPMGCCCWRRVCCGRCCVAAGHAWCGLIFAQASPAVEGRFIGKVCPVPVAQDLECCLLRGGTCRFGVGAAMLRMISGSCSCAPPERGDV